MSSTPPTPASTSKPTTPPTSSSPGAFKALEHTGVPSSFLASFWKKPRLPSRNWLIFIGVVSSISFLYYDDRRKCKRIREEYVNKVKHLAEDKLETYELPRKVIVFACKFPGDDEYDRSKKYFKKYVKPILVPAAIDYEIHNGNKHGSLIHLISDKIKARRRLDLGIDTPSQTLLPPTPLKFTLAQQRQRELEGGTVIIGRHTLKEYTEGLRRGWSEGLDKVDREEQVAQELMNDGKFDEPEPEFQPEGRADDDSLAPSSAPGLPLSPPALYSPLSQPKSPVTPPRAPSRPGIPPHLNTPPAQIPEQAPLLLVPYHVHLGFRNIPFSIRDFFYERRKVREGAEAAYRLIMSQTRDFRGPNEQPSDLDFDTKAENSFRPSYSNLPAEIASSRKKYYTEELPPKLKLARELASNEREPTKDETKYPPPTEVELRAERLKKEMKWRDDEEAWEVLRKGKPVVWDERFKDSLKVFEDADVGSGWSGQ